MAEEKHSCTAGNARNTSKEESMEDTARSLVGLFLRYKTASNFLDLLECFIPVVAPAVAVGLFSGHVHALWRAERIVFHLSI